MNIDIYPPSIVDALKEKQHVDFIAESGFCLRIYIIAQDIIRFRYAIEGIFEEDFTYSITKLYKSTDTYYQLTDDKDEYILETAKLIVRIKKSNFKKEILDHTGLSILNDEKGFHWEENEHYGGQIVKQSHHITGSEHFYGLGDKTEHPNLRGKRFLNWCSDVYGFDKGSDPLYKSIPFFIGLHSDTAYGIFFDNSFRTHFDFGSERKSVSSFWADGGEMNYYFIYGPEMREVCEKYVKLTGMPDMPPLWTLGYHQCKWSYYPESKVIEITNKFREEKIPCDAIYLDIDYMEGFRCFTWDKDKFPNPESMVKDLQDKGFKTVVIIDPGIKVDPNYFVFAQGMEYNYFCRRADGPIFKGKVWPGDCYFPDFTNPKVRKWWSGLFEDMISNTGVRGVWNDMNEPAVFEVPSKTFPLDVRHDYDGHPCSHRKAHNVYGMQMARATFKGVKKYLKEKNLRPFVITRSAFSGTQRYTSAWTGDNKASWEHIWLANVQCQRLSISGFSFVGSDVGGFIDHPTPELYVRYIQLATFHVFFRTHSSGDHGDQEPWSFGAKALAIVRKYIELRYKLLPYFYTAFYQYVKRGTPILRPLVMYDQYDTETHNRADEFLHGDHILTCPILEPNSRGRYLYLPKGKWYFFWDDKKYDGGEELWLSVTLENSPIFIRAGAVIPMQAAMQYVGEKQIDTLDLHVYFGENETLSLLYEDAGDGYEYEVGVYNEKLFIVSGTTHSIHIHQDIKGHYNPTYKQYKIIIRGLEFEPLKVSLNGSEVEIKSLTKKEKTVELLVPIKFIDLIISG